MTTITVTTHRPQNPALWILAITAAVLVAGVVVGLVLAFTGSSDGGGGAPTTGSVVKTTQGGSGGTSLCPGSVKDWTC